MLTNSGNNSNSYTNITSLLRLHVTFDLWDSYTGICLLSCYNHVLASKYPSTKQSQKYNVVILFIHYRLSFSLLRSAIMCLRGSRSTAGRPQRDLTDFSLAVSEGKLPNYNLVYEFTIFKVFLLFSFQKKSI